MRLCTPAVKGGDMNRSVGPTLVRQVNEVATLGVLRRAGPISAPELVRRLGTSRPTVDAVLEGLVEQGWVSAAQPEPSNRRTSGRPPRLFAFRADAHYVAGLDLGGRHSRALVSDLAGTVVGEGTLSADRTPDEPRARAAAVVRSACRASGIEPGQLAAVVAGVPGIVSPEGTVVQTGYGEFSGTDGTFLPGRRTTIRRLLNDVNLAAAAEAWRGAATGIDDLLYILVGERIGAGLLIGGVPHVGAKGAAGELGTLQSLGWASIHEDLMERSGSHTDAGRTMSAVASLLTADPPDTRADFLPRLVEAMAQGIAAGALTFDPEVVVVGGIEGAEELLMPLLRQRLERLTSVPIAVIPSTVGDDRVCLGAIRAALSELDRRLFQPGDMRLPEPVVLI